MHLLKLFGRESPALDFLSPAHGPTKRYTSSLPVDGRNDLPDRSQRHFDVLHVRHFVKNHNPDIICLQETKAHPDQVDIDLGGYEGYWFSAEKKGYSGTAIFSKIEPEDVIYGLPEHISVKYQLADSYGDTTAEGRVTTLEFENYYISTVYTPNAKDDLSRIPMREAWDPAYLEYMCELEAMKPVIYCGDFNVAHTELDLARPKENVGKKGFTTEERAGFTAMEATGFVDTLRHLYPNEPNLYTWCVPRPRRACP